MERCVTVKGPLVTPWQVR